MLEPFHSWVERDPDQLLYAFLDVDGRAAESYSYAQFLQRTTDIASHIRRTRPLQPGARVLLAYPPGLEMICAFVACVRLGLIPVPVYPPAGNGFQAALGKMNFIARDCRAAAVLTDRSYYWSMRLNETRHRVATLSLRRSPASRLAWIVTTDAERGCRETIADVHSPVLFLQYTSGSTSEPKGVMVTHDNLLDNCEAVVDHRPIGVSWLPQYHDMGLIGYYLFFSMRGGRHTASLPSTSSGDRRSGSRRSAGIVAPRRRLPTSLTSIASGRTRCWRRRSRSSTCAPSGS